MKVFNNIITTTDGTSRILLYGDVGDGCRVDSAHVVAELMSIEAESQKIEVHINSRGGDVFHGIAIYNALAASTADISIHVDGIAASIAAIIALCGKPLYMAKHAKLMLHAVSGGTYGTAAELRETAQLIEELQESLADMIAKKVGEKPEAIVAKYFADGADHWLSAAEADTMGLIDGIIDGPAVPPSDNEDEIYQFINQYSSPMALSEEIKKMPAFTGKSDEEIVAIVRKQADSTTLVDSLKKANATLQARVAELEAKEVDAVLDAAVADGRITAELKPMYVKLMDSDRETTEVILAQLPKKSKQRVDDFIETGTTGRGSLASKSWDELDRAGMLTELKAQDPTAFAAKFKEKFGCDYKE